VIDGYDDASRLRNRRKASDDAATRDDGRTTRGAPSLAVQTTTVASYPTAASAFYAVAALTVLGTEVEGGAATITAGTTPFYALNLGTAIPPSGTQVIVTFVDHRWVFRYDG
jgi:hypothetical protein